MTFRHLTCRIAAFLVLSVWLVAAGAQESPLRWRIVLDAPGNVRKLLEQHLDIYRYRNRPEVDALLPQRITSLTAEGARQLLATEGYFSPQVEVALDRNNEESVVRLRVDPGQQTQVASASIKITGVIAESPAESKRREQIVSRCRRPGTNQLPSERWRLRGTAGAESAGDILFRIRFD